VFSIEVKKSPVLSISQIHFPCAGHMFHPPA